MTVVVVVGTHTPVGARIADRLTARGAEVVAVARPTVPGANGDSRLVPGVRPAEGDRDGPGAVVAAAQEGAGGRRITAVVHADVDPAVYQATRLADLTPERWQALCARPVDAALATAWAAFELMATGDGRPGQGGVLGFVCPTVALTGAAGQVAASTAGEAVRLLAKSAARRWGRFGITSNAFALRLDPVPAGTDRLQVHTTALPSDGLDPADDVASLLLYLATPTAARLTGATFTADGGELMTP